ncbi:MAG: glutamate--tRNA ligase [Deltaproteobacteria bacterium]|nr:glutamate--tRNA ligase [Deltaproteobacteria bacterium]
MNHAVTSPPRVRIAPSPTGDPHIGTAYIALFNYVFAKKHGGKFIIRIEDTDRTRYRAESEAMILDAIKWFGIEWDEGPDIGGPYGPYKQSERLPRYQEAAKTLIEKGAAYRCFCTVERLDKLREVQNANKLPPGYDRHCRTLDSAESNRRAAAGEKFTVRFKMPTTGVTSFDDQIRGKVEFENARLDDLVLLKADGFPTYHLASVVDDNAMKITHVIRGEEWVSSTPKHVLLYEAFGWTAPSFTHLNLLRNTDKSKISKRKNPTSILYYRRKGILPSALRNFLALMGWSLGGDQELFSTETMIENFTWERFSLGGPVFDLQKLLWMNSQYLKELPDEMWVSLLREQVFNENYLKQIIPLVKERVQAFEEFIPNTDFFFAGDLKYENTPILPKGLSGKMVATWFSEVLEALEGLDTWTVASIKGLMETFVEQQKIKAKDLYMPMRVAISGTLVSPPLMETIQVLGKEMVRRRMRLAMDYLKAQKPPESSPKPA